jgi:hypothetical protein
LQNRFMFAIATIVIFPAALAAQPKPVLSEDVYKNVQLFRGKPAVRLLPAMVALNGLLGVECTHCHVPLDWDKDDKAEKKTALKMFDMIEYLNKDHFGGENRISCWTCHRGHPQPLGLTSDPASVESAKKLIALPADAENKPAEQVFRNIQTLRGVPAGRFAAIMASFSRALGVECSHCHVPNQWDQDQVAAKNTARKMLAMVGATIKKYYGGNGPVGCYSCHQGNVKPVLNPA